MTPRIELVPESTGDIRKVILDGLVDFNRTVLAPDMPIQDIAVAIHDGETGAVVGGLWGRTGWEWLTVELIFVPERLRGQGIARRLLATAEDEALRRGCHSAWLDTLNPGALAVYERDGYVRFGELRDFPSGRSRFFLQKRLAADQRDPTPQSSASMAQRS